MEIVDAIGRMYRLTFAIEVARRAEEILRAEGIEGHASGLTRQQALAQAATQLAGDMQYLNQQIWE